MKKLCVLLSLLVLIGLCGCTPQRNSDGQYSAEFSYDPQQYMMFVSKQIQAPVNHLSDMMGAIGKYEQGEVSAQGLYYLARSGYETVSESARAIRYMRPPEAYKETAERLTVYLSAVQEQYASLIELLAEEEPDADAIGTIADQLHESYLLITAEANAYWK